MKDLDVIEKFLKDHPEVEMFEVILHDLNGYHRGKWLPRSQIKKVFKGGFKMPQNVCSLDCWGRDLPALVEETGDADGVCTPVVDTLALVPWADRPTAQVVVTMGGYGGDKPYGGDPRVVLESVVNRFKKLGLTPVVASEMEFHLFHRDTDDNGTPVHTQAPRSGGIAVGGDTYDLEVMREVAPLMDAIDNAAREQHLPVDTLITEFGPSQYEINLLHQDDALRACDQGSMLRRAIRGVARQHGQIATFMAKPFGDEVGNGMHVHFSVLDEQGNNAFANGTEEGSELLNQAVAGCLASMADCMAIFAPNINSYRRMAPGCYAPLCPNWGYENRTTAIRIPGGDVKNVRIEHRIAGADANVYLTVAAMLAGALYGIENKMKAPDPVEGDASDVKPELPHHWNDALDAFEKSEFIREYLGEELQRTFAMCKRQEKKEFDTRVTALEYDSFL